VVGVALVVRNDGVLQRLLDEVVRACGAVVEDEIVEVVSVLRTVIGDERIVDALFLLVGEIEFLPIGFATDTTVERHEIVIGFDTELVVGFSFDELDVEILFHQAEHTIVEDYINLIGIVYHTDSSMTVLGPYLLALGAREQVYLCTIAEWFSSKRASG
jgi:hypothetical protein